MKGFIKVAVATPDMKVADCRYNVEQMIKKAKKMAKKGVRLLVFPELSVTGATCGDLFFQDTLIKAAERAVYDFVEGTKKLPMVCVIGTPLSHKGRLYNTAIVVNQGEVSGIVPKVNADSRYFATGKEVQDDYEFSWGDVVDFGTDILFEDTEGPEDGFCLAVEVGNDTWLPQAPSCRHALAGALLIANPSATPEIVGAAKHRSELLKMQSAKTMTAYLCAEAGVGESTTDMVFGGQGLIVERGTVLGKSKPFADKDVVTETDICLLKNERRKNTAFPVNDQTEEQYKVVGVSFDGAKEGEFTRKFEKLPFIPSDKNKREERCQEILTIQTMGLVKRLRHTGCKCAVLGLSGGLDSTLALLVTVRAFDRLGLDRKGIVSVTMPCFGTTNRTYDNAVNLAKELGATLREVNIKNAVEVHFKDIGQDMDNHDVTFENGQARERTQVLMDIANQTGGMVIGTGDLSELALGWATYNGDHMSMYGVNASIPKTLVRYLVQYEADNAKNKNLQKVLYDVLDTPVSPELLPPKDGEIAQKTEDIVGPYELHDFFMYYMLRYGFSMSRIFDMAVNAFEDEYEKEVIYKWLSTFCHRFFRQQFKRSCLPDGPKVGSVSVSPRGDLCLPSDASDALWKEELDRIREGLV